MYIVYSHVPKFVISKGNSSGVNKMGSQPTLSIPREVRGCRLCKHCGCMLNTEFTQVTYQWPAHAAYQEQEINFVKLCVCLFAAIYLKFKMSTFKYFVKTKHPRACDMPSPLLRRWRATARAQRRREAQGMKTTQVNARMAIADHDRQGQATHRQYKSHTVVES